MEKKRTGNSGARVKLHRLLFVNPKSTVSMDELADRLIALKLVQEIFLAAMRRATWQRSGSTCSPSHS